MELKKYKLGEIAYFVEDKISSANVSLNEYITTDCLLQNKKGRTIAQNLPPKPCSLTKFKKGDVLIGNIRPYLKKIWFADIDGGCSPDVLTLRAKNENESSYLYSLLLQDDFYDFVMKAVKGSKMPRGDKKHILTFLCLDIKNKTKIGDLLSNIDSKIALNRRINAKLEQIAKRLYDYWFVQFNFPDKNGKPYKSSGGKMVWNEVLKREVPEGWEVKRLSDFICKNNTGDWGADEPTDKTIEVGCIRGADIIALNDLPKRFIKSTNTEKLLSEWDMVIEVSGGSPVQATGRCALITPGVIKRNGNKITCSNFCHAFSFKDYRFSAYFYYLWKMFYDNGIMFNYEGKTSGIKNFMTETFLANKWVSAPETLAEKFFEIIKETYAKIDTNIAENNKLIALRDKLLPLLMNGQVEVK